MSNRTIPLLALIALSLTSLAALRRAHRRRLAATSSAMPQPLQTWEGEGGGSPVGTAMEATTAGTSEN